MGKFKIEVRKLTQVGTDWIYQRIGQIDTYLAIDVIVRYNDVGTWSIKMQSGNSQAALLQPGTGIVLWYDELNTPLMSGPVRRIDRASGPDDPGMGTVTFSGVDDNCLFTEHICLPDPVNGLSAPDVNGLNGYRQTVAYYGDNTSQSLERLVYSLAYYNFGPGNNAGRTVKGVSMDAPATWPAATAYPRTTYQLRFETVQDALKDRIENGTDASNAKIPLGWRWVWDAATQTIKFHLYRPFNDPTAGKSVRFSYEIGNLLSYSYSVVAPKATWYLLGLDQETDQKPETQNLWISDKRSADDWNTSAELYSEHTDISLLKRDANDKIIIGTDNKASVDTDAINTAIATDDQDNAASGVLSITPLDTVGCKFGRDYYLGDLVTVAIDGEEITDVLREVHITDDTDGPQVVPTIGTPDASETPMLYSEVQRLWRAVNRSRRLKDGNRYG